MRQSAINCSIKLSYIIIFDSINIVLRMAVWRELLIRCLVI